MTYPKGETVWLQAYDGEGRTRYIITSPPDRHVYYLYEPDGKGGWTRWGKNVSAGILSQRYEARRA